MASKTLVIGAIANYEYDKVEPWLESLSATGFDGKVALIVYKGSKQLIEKLQEKNVNVFALEPDGNGGVKYSAMDNIGWSIMVDRFIHMWMFIQKSEDVDYIVATDVKDVIFQQDPSSFFYGNECIYAGEEGFTYSVEPWSRSNMRAAFGHGIWETMKDKPILCAGVLAGEKQLMLDLFLQVYLLCRGTLQNVPGGGGPDQAALNILLHSRPWSEFLVPTEAILHAGTSIPGIKAGNGDIGAHYKQTPEILDYYKENFLRTDEPIIVDDEIKDMHNEDHFPYFIVHQYDRIPEWKALVDRKYRK